MRDILQSDLLCPNCAGQRTFSIADQALVCDSCGTAEPVTSGRNEDVAPEQPYAHANPPTHPTAQPEGTTYLCETCRGKVVFDGAAMSTHCPYCNGALVKSDSDPAYTAMAMQRFVITKEQAHAKMIEWVKARRMAPIGLHRTVAKSTARPIYAPFWTFDSKEDVQYSATVTRYHLFHGFVTRNEQGNFRTRLNDVLMPGSPHVPTLLRDGIISHFNPRKLIPYNAAFLAGIPAEHHHMSVTRGMDLAGPDRHRAIDIRVRNRVGRTAERVTHRTTTTDISYRRVLLPVYVLHYNWKGQSYKIATCGSTGQTYGERPYSKLKLMSGGVVLAAASLGLGWLIGASAAPLPGL